MTISVFVDAGFADNKSNRCSQSKILIFYNREPIYWYSKQQPNVENSTFGAEFCAMRIAVNMVKALRYKLRMFGVPISGPSNIFVTTR